MNFYLFNDLSGLVGYLFPNLQITNSRIYVLFPHQGPHQVNKNTNLTESNIYVA